MFIIRYFIKNTPEMSVCEWLGGWKCNPGGNLACKSYIGETFNLLSVLFSSFLIIWLWLLFGWYFLSRILNIFVNKKR